MEYEDNFIEAISRHFHLNKVVYYCLPYSYKLDPPIPGTYEWMVWKGIAHLAGTQQSMKESVPFHSVYSFSTFKYWLNTRYPIPLSAWRNISNVFQPTVWLLIFISLAILSFFFLIIFKFYTFVMPEQNLTYYSRVENIDFFLLTCASIMEPDPINWFNKRAVAGRLLMAVWMFSCLMLNLAFNSNLRTVNSILITDGCFCCSGRTLI